MALVGAALPRSHLVLMRAGCYHAPMLFQPPHEELSDADIVAMLCEAMAGAGRLPRSADVYLASVQDTCKKWSRERRAPQIPFCNSVFAHYGPIATWTPRRRCRWEFAGVSGNGHADACQRDIRFQRDRRPLATVQKGKPSWTGARFRTGAACDHFLHVS
jgi:hypothetical protein